MDLNKVRRLLDVIKKSELAEVEIEEGDFRLVVRRDTPVTAVATHSVAAAPAINPAPAAAPAAASPSPAADTSAPQPAASGVEVRAPIVGTFYAAPNPDSPAFVKVGDKVNPGDVLCIIEAMKLMNEIECEVSGTVTAINVQNAQGVEYDQVLFLIDPA
ncbi:MAG: acetyl-CoA carboxylase biotin carboxyl carrier protein [Bacteroidetes bacterium]|jgi:acetyl-CoA carboxylase biotin carboxyl carrier protein|nr:acetyl-CoA carboxylase biotin carboxyl carrier protein [Bacteroidota bacterium]